MVVKVHECGCEGSRVWFKSMVRFTSVVVKVHECGCEGSRVWL